MLCNVRMKTSVIIVISFNDDSFLWWTGWLYQSNTSLLDKSTPHTHAGVIRVSSWVDSQKVVNIWFFGCQASDYVYIVQAVKPWTVFVCSRDRSSKLFEPGIFFSGQFQGKIGPHQKILFLLVFKRPGCWLKRFLGCFGILFLDVFGQHRNSWQKQRKSAQTWRRRFELPLANGFLGYFRMANGNWCWIFHTVCHTYMISNIDCLTVWYTCVDLCRVYRLRVDILSIP